MINLMKILITGGAGFIGSHLADYFVKQSYDVVILDNLSSGKYENMPNCVEFIKGDITDINIVKKAVFGADYVFHLAAMVSVPLSFENPDKCNDINVEGFRNVLEESLKQNVKKVMFSSSAAIYGDNPHIPLQENEPYAPMSPYAVSKVDGEKLCEEYSKKGLKTCALRYFNVYGTRQDPKSPYSGVISIFCDRAKANQDIIIYGDGNQTRDFIHVSDVVAANVLAMQTLEGVYNVATGINIMIKELAESIINMYNSKSEIIYKEERKGDIKKSLADILKIKRFGFMPKVDIIDGLKEI